MESNKFNRLGIEKIVSKNQDGTSSVRYKIPYQVPIESMKQHDKATKYFNKSAKKIGKDISRQGYRFFNVSVPEDCVPYFWEGITTRKNSLEIASKLLGERVSDSLNLYQGISAMSDLERVFKESAEFRNYYRNLQRVL